MNKNTGRSKFRKIKILIDVLVFLFNILPRFVNEFLFVIIRGIPGYIGLLFRYVLLKNLAYKCGENVSIHSGVYLKSIKNLSLGNNVSIHSMCYIDASGIIEIKDEVSIAHATTIMSTNHTWIEKDKPIKYNEITKHKVTIFSDVWIGCGCRILGGVKIEERSIVAAGAVVNKNVESKTIYGGVPAVKIKKIY